ncbi:hypothetical protein LWI29_004634 [Acer saccharum]|uniref:J domain-containing protein n=1 Tax=Acer saccharum TaxID=4024 RepID=A0AA39RG14_ACESA|nr:hypothetical protein LWI29_004634 [Acer saccharum]
MRRERISRDCSQPRTWTRKQTLKSCEMKGGLDNVVVIDVDSDKLDNVIIIDVPESIQQNLRSSSVSRKGKKIEFRGIISIDDDETDNVDPTVPDYVHKSKDLDDDECRVVREENPAFKFSKCKQAFSGKNSCKNRFGLYPESESGSSDSDYSDCAVMEDSFGKIHAEWEKASLKRKSNVCKGTSGLEDQCSPSFMNVDTQTDAGIEVGKRTEQYSETAFCSNSSSVNHEKQKFSAFVPTEDGYPGTASQNPGKESSFGEFDKKVEQDNFSWLPPDLTESRESFLMKDDLHFSREIFTDDPSTSSWWKSNEHVNDGGGTVRNEKQSTQEPSLCSTQEHSAKHCDDIKTCCTDKGKNIMGDRSNFQRFNRHFVHGKTSFDDEEDSFTHANNERVVPNDKDEEVYQETPSCSTSPRKSHHLRAEFGKEKPSSGEPVVASNSQPSYETGVECCARPSEYKVGAVFEESFLCKTPSSGISESCNVKASQQDTDKPNSEGAFLSKNQCAETQGKQGSSRLAEVQKQVICSTSNDLRHEGKEPFHAQGVSPSIQGDIINEREKLKETDEYKQAMEEEWASRQQQLKIQAEEAQRLRKKKRVESMRLLDMERRQKQRLEEIRETQKKDEENMNLKEKFRVEVMKELHKLETTCIDMASLLRGLGINVGSSFNPLSNEVHAAYKRALLRFHPDRASKTDIRQQVEAEEKFKLISRMKEKFLSTSCY